MSQEFNFTTEVFSAARADVSTPVELYASLRRIFPETILLECAEPHSPETAASYVCADPIVRFSIANGMARIERAGRSIYEIELKDPGSIIAAFEQFQNSIKILFSADEQVEKKLTGLFGYLGFSAIPYFEDIWFPKTPPAAEEIPEMQFALYRFVFRIDHFQNTLEAIKLSETRGDEKQTVGLSELFAEMTNCRAAEVPLFATTGEEFSELSDTDFAEIVRRCQRHIRRGDVFQIVPSCKFSIPFRGDEFAVYLALRRINPSPFLFFFDYGGFSLFGSSPEAQLLIKNNVATLHPIAGTYPRGATEAQDREFAEARPCISRSSRFAESKFEDCRTARACRNAFP